MGTVNLIDATRPSSPWDGARGELDGLPGDRASLNTDYPKIATLNGCVDYVAARAAAGTP